MTVLLVDADVALASVRPAAAPIVMSIVARLHVFVLLWQENRGVGVVGLCDDPDAAFCNRVGAEDAPAVLQREFVLPTIVSIYLSPVPGAMADQQEKSVCSGLVGDRGLRRFLLAA